MGIRVSEPSWNVFVEQLPVHGTIQNSSSGLMHFVKKLIPNIKERYLKIEIFKTCQLKIPILKVETFY